ncbi:hypothetical protein GCM10027181_24090 [Rheinheimera gaetbuli]
MNWGTPFSAMILVFVFGSVALLDIEPTFVYCAIAGVLFRFAFTLLDVPLNASVGRIDADPTRRNYIAASRSVAATGAKVIIAVLVYLYAETDKTIVPADLWVVALIVAVLSVVIVIPSFSYVDKQAKQLDHRYEKRCDMPMLTMRHLFPNNLIFLYLANLFVILFINQFSNALIFMINNNSDLSLSFSVVWQVMSLVSAFTVIIWSIFAKNYGKKATAQIGLMALFIITPCYFFSKTSELSLLIFLVTFAGLHHINTHIWSLLPDIVDQISKVVKSNVQVLIIGWFAAIGKVMIGLSSLVTGFLLEISGFPKSPAMDSYELTVVSLVMLGIAGALFALLLIPPAKLSDS